MLGWLTVLMFAMHLRNLASAKAKMLDRVNFCWIRAVTGE